MRERALVEQNTDLKVRLNEHLEYLTVTKFNLVFRDGQLSIKESQDLGKKLAEYCRIHRIEIRKCETQDERFAYTNSYPLFVWEHFYPDECFDCLLLQEFQQNKEI
ncbi:MAG: hypothetical protein LBC74_02335 [Planctomycetaceae bacterium]|jgi:hypothetical protein|nr:hypothetical protein [Planctomycetaceae bacterium]